MKFLRIFLALIAIAVALIAPANRSDNYSSRHTITLSNYWKKVTPQDSMSQLGQKPQHKKTDSIIVAGVGDLMLGTNYPHKYLLPPKNGKELMTAVNPVIQEADVAFGNLAGPVLNKGGKRKHCQDSTKNCFAFRTPEIVASSILASGFDVLNVGNNHINDFGKPGIISTLGFLRKHKMPHAGLDSIPYSIFEKEGIRYGFAAFTPYDTITIHMHDSTRVSKIIRQLDQQADVVIVSVRAGGEGAAYQRVTKKTEYFAGENRGNIYQFAHFAVNQGADIIFGHGPHVNRAIEVYNKRFIAYSLGNFCTYSGIYRKGVSGIAPIARVIIRANGEFITAQLVSTRQLRNGKVVIDPQKQALHVIKKLTQLDFPESKLTIDNDGWVTTRQTSK